MVTISGSKGYTGACILAIQAAMKTGVGIVKAIIPESLNVVLEAKLTEAITVPIQEHDTGNFTTENSSDILIETDWADAVLFGPGLKVDANAGDWMAQVLRKLEKPIILDASGFLPLIENKMTVCELPAETILTPHYAEFSRIFNLDIIQVINNIDDILQDNNYIKIIITDTIENIKIFKKSINYQKLIDHKIKLIFISLKTININNIENKTYNKILTELINKESKEFIKYANTILN